MHAQIRSGATIYRSRTADWRYYANASSVDMDDDDGYDGGGGSREKEEGDSPFATSSSNSSSSSSGVDMSERKNGGGKTKQKKDATRGAGEEKLVACPLPALSHMTGGLLWVDARRTREELSRLRRSDPMGRKRPDLLQPCVLFL